MSDLVILFSALVLSIGATVFVFLRGRRVDVRLKELEKKIKTENEKKEKEISHRLYELAILKDLGERVGYSLNVQNVADMITGSLRSFMDYSVVSYMLLGPEKIIFKANLERSVSPLFIEDIKGRMLKSLSALLDKDLSKSQVEPVISGAITVDEIQDPVRSFFNIPLVIGNKVVGVLTVADTKEGQYNESETSILYKITKQASQAVSRLQDVVENEQRKLNSMIESMVEGIVMTDKEYRILAINPAAKKIVGIEEKIEVLIFDLIDGLGGAFDIRGRLEESVKLKKIITLDDVLVHDRFYQIFVSPVENKTGVSGEEILGGVVIFHDITHEKEVERLREDFTSMMVHELRTPLVGTSSTIQLLKEGILKPGKKEYKEMISLMGSNVESMIELVNDLLDQAKIEAGKFQIFVEPSNIRDVVKAKVHAFGPLAKDSGIKLHAVIDEHVPEMILFDANKIGQVLNNFISNSLKFTGKGGRVTISVLMHANAGDIAAEAGAASIEWFIKDSEERLKKLPPGIFVAVTDSGVGIAPSDIPSLFSKFKQVNGRVKSEKKGTGLGLAIAKGIVEAHRGIVGVSSEEGLGSTFYCFIPLDQN